MFCSISLNEVWVKGFFLMVPIRSMELLDLLSMMTWLEHTLIHIFRSILCYLKTHGFSCSTLGSFDVGGTSSNTGMNRFMIGEIFFSSHILCYIFIILSFMDVWVRLLWVIWSLLVFFSHYSVHILVEILHSLLGWKNTGWIFWCISHPFGESLWDMISSPMSLDQILLVTWSLYALGKWWSTYLEV